MPRKPKNDKPVDRFLPQIRTAALPLAWLVGAIVTVWAGFRPDPYLEHVRLMPPPHPYPTATVVWVVLFMTVQASLLLAILRPATYRHSWGRALSALAVSLGFLPIGIMGAMHAPPAFGVYIVWLLVWAGSMLLLLLGSLISAAAPRTRGLVPALAAAALFFALLAGLIALDHAPLGVVAFYMLMSAASFAMYGIDKSAATSGRWRTKEATLHLFEVAGGWPGALVAQRLFRHKTRKQPFQFIFWCGVLVNCAALGWVLYPEAAAQLRSLGIG